MAKFNPLNYVEVKPNVYHQAPKGALRVMCTSPCNTFIQVQGIEVLAETEQKVDLQVQEDFEFKVETPDKKARVFLYDPFIQEMVKTGEVMTNPDRGIEESGTMQIIRQEMRKLEYRRQQDLQRMSAKHKADINALKISRGEPITADLGEPENETEEVETDEDTTETEVTTETQE